MIADTVLSRTRAGERLYFYWVDWPTPRLIVRKGFKMSTAFDFGLRDTVWAAYGRC